MKIARIVAGILAAPFVALLILAVFWPDALRHNHSSAWATYELISLCPGIPILAVNYLLWFEPHIIQSIVHGNHQEE